MLTENLRSSTCLLASPRPLRISVREFRNHFKFLQPVVTISAQFTTNVCNQLLAASYHPYSFPASTVARGQIERIARMRPPRTKPVHRPARSPCGLMQLLPNSDLWDFTTSRSERPTIRGEQPQVLQVTPLK